VVGEDTHVARLCGNVDLDTIWRKKFIVSPR
jgi:hypothetical protein